MKHALTLTLCGLGLGALSLCPASAQVYVGKYSVEDGAPWATNPVCYTPQEAAALLFGGVASDYAISTKGDDPALIDHMGWEDGWGNTSHCMDDGGNLGTPVAEDFKVGANYDPVHPNPPSPTTFSAYVHDHGDSTSINYVFRVSSAPVSVPEPGCVALLAVTCLSGAGLLIRRRVRK